MNEWWIFQGTREPHDQIVQKLPDAPGWRKFARTMGDGAPPVAMGMPREPGNAIRGATYMASDDERDLVNAALYLRRPLLVTGLPGTGKTSLAYAVAYELRLGPVLVWPITTRSTLQDGLYRYDAIARMQATTLGEPATDIGRYLRLGPLGTAFRASDPKRPRVLLIDEIDKSDIDLPNDLLHIFEEGSFEIPELARLPERDDYRRLAIRPADDGEALTIERGRVTCPEFPFVVLTSNGERDFPPAFLRRCIQLTIEPPDDVKLAQIIEQHLHLTRDQQPQDLVKEFLDRKTEVATDQLLNAIYLTMKQVDVRDRQRLRTALLKSLTSS